MREALLKEGWRQGSIIADVDLASLAAATGFSVQEGVVCIIVSQSCDVVCDNIEQEPTFEFIKGVRISSPEPLKIAARNPRELHLPIETVDGTKHVRLRMLDRMFANRTWLVSRKPSGTDLSDDSLRCLVHWMAARYQRTALPDAFNERIDARRKKITEVLDKAPELSGLYVALSPTGEADEETPYQIALLGLTSESVYADPERRERLEGVLQKIAARLAQCDRIDVRDFSLRAESDVSVADIKRYRRFEFDFLSLRAPRIHAEPGKNIF